MLPAPASVRSPRDTQPTFAPPVFGLATYAPSYGSGQLVNHGGKQMANAGFFAVYWNGSVANAGGSGVTSLGYATLQSQVSDFTRLFADNLNYTQSDPGRAAHRAGRSAATTATSPMAAWTSSTHRSRT